MDQSPVFKETERKIQNKFKVLFLTSTMDLENALNEGYTIDKEGTELLKEVVILYKEGR